MSVSAIGTEHITSLFCSHLFHSSSLCIYINSEAENCQINEITQEISTLHLAQSQLCLLSFIRYWKERHLRPDSNASGCFPNDVSSPVLPKIAEHYGKCATFLASLCSDEGVIRRRIHWGTSGL